MATQGSTQTRYSAELKKKPDSPILDREALQLLEKIQDVLAVKAPEVIPLLDQFLGKLSFLYSDVVECEKRRRSIVIFGVPEADKAAPPSQRQAHTERYVSDVLDFLDIEARPSELFRMGPSQTDKPRLVKCVFSQRRYQLEILSRSNRLRSSATFKNVFIRKSMTREERAKEGELRRRARELNDQEHGGNRVFVVYKGELMKKSDIQNFSKAVSSPHFRQKNA
ncbi:hypothetical protein Q1695_015528 [Nippostrongylus brasiliensis]|nr:hypothetical protein Q1695_015528 [Nippostrongylus brasiliensis]